MGDDSKEPKRRQKGKGTITQRANGKYQGRIKVAGYGQFSCTGNTRQEVQHKMDEFRKSTLRDEVVPQRIMVGRFIESWLENVKKPTLKPSSYDRLEETYKWYIKNSKVARLQLGNIKPMDIQQLINEKSLTLSSSSIRKIYELLHAAFEYAVVSRMINFNPTTGVEMPREENVKVKKKTIQMFTEEELAQIEKVAEIKYTNGEPRFRHTWFFILIANTGLRAGEAIALRWDNVDLENKLIHVTENASYVQDREGSTGYKYETIITSVKTKSGNRTIPCNETAMKALHWLKEYQETHGLNSDYVDCNKHGGMLKHSSLINLLRPILKEAKVPLRGCHAFRHSFATRLIEAGVDAKTVSQLLGHTSVNVTYDIYIHPNMEHAIDAVNLLDKKNEE